MNRSDQLPMSLRGTTTPRLSTEVSFAQSSRLEYTRDSFYDSTNAPFETGCSFKPIPNAPSPKNLSTTTGICITSEVFVFDNTSALCDDLRFIINVPELCDVTFLVGPEQVPIYGLKAILATRSRTFFQTLLDQHDCLLNGLPVKPMKKRSLRGNLYQFAQRLASRFSRGRKLSPADRLTFTVDDFSPDIFSQLVAFLHSGEIELTIHNVIGILNASDSYGVDDLRASCLHYTRRLIDFNSVLPLLASAESYKEFPLTQIIINEILHFIDTRAQTVLRLKNFHVLSHDTAVSILSRSTLQATEAAKWDAAFLWSRRHSEEQGNHVMRLTLKTFTSLIRFTEIPLKKLSTEILPLGVLQDEIIKQAIDSQRAHFSFNMPGPLNSTARFSLRKQKGTSCLRRAFSFHHKQSDDSGVAGVEAGDSISS